jgi:hypothetical protein
MDVFEEDAEQHTIPMEALPGFLGAGKMVQQHCIFHRMKKKCCRKYRKGKRCGSCPGKR